MSSGHLPHDPRQEGRLGDEAAPSHLGGLLQRGVAHEARADAGDDGSNSTMPVTVVSEGGLVGRPARPPFVAAVETNDEGHPLCMMVTVVEGFRLSEIAAWAQLEGQGNRPCRHRKGHERWRRDHDESNSPWGLSPWKATKCSRSPARCRWRPSPNRSREFEL